MAKVQIVAAKANGNKVNGIEIPYREGSYRNCILTLLKLGKGKAHAFDAVVKTYKAVCGKDHWQEFSSKKLRNKETADAPTEKIITNCRVLTRGGDYGYPLNAKAKLQMVVDSKAKTVALMPFKGKAVLCERLAKKAAKAIKKPIRLTPKAK